VVDVRYSFNPTQSHAIQVHFDAPLLDIIRVLPGAVKLKKLATALLTLVALSALAMPVLDCLARVAIQAFHTSILAKYHYLFRNAFEDAVQLACAMALNLDAIVTRDTQGFAGATLPILSAGEVLQLLSENLEESN